MIAPSLPLFFSAQFVQGVPPMPILLSVIRRILRFAAMSNAKHCVPLAIALYLSLGEAAAQPRKIVIDCDPGIDDAMAIVLAMQYSGFEIIGISAGFGNAYVGQATQNALTVVELSGRTIPVYQGAAKPRRIAAEPPPDFVHGKDGLGNTNQPRPKSSPQPKSAAQFLVDTAGRFPGQITLVAVGRLTNLADAIRLDASFTSNIREVVLMGGAFHVPGNVSPVAEANISGDPDAADIVLTAPWKVTMLALNTTTKVKLTDEILLRIRDQNDRYGRFIWSITRFYMDFHKNVNHVEGGFYVHDPSAIMFLIDPGLFTIRKGPVRVVTDGIALGETIMPAYDYQLDLPPWRGRPAVTTATDVDSKRFLETFESVMTRKEIAEKHQLSRSGWRPRSPTRRPASAGGRGTSSFPWRHPVSVTRRRLKSVKLAARTDTARRTASSGSRSCS